MLGVSTPPSLNGFGGYGGPSSSRLPSAPTGPPGGASPGSSNIDDEIATLKRNASDQANLQTKSKPTLQMVRAARALYDRGKEQERTGDPKTALQAMVKMSQIMSNVFANVPPHEFREAMKDWPNYGNDLTDAKKLVDDLEAKIRSAAEESESSGVKSIQDRLKALQANGLQVSSKPSKRAPPPPSPAPIVTPVLTPHSSGSSRRMSAPPSPLKRTLATPIEPSPPPPPPSAPYTLSEFTLPSVPARPFPPSFSAPHTLVPTATLGDSPLSSPASSPHIPQQNLTGLSPMPEVDDIDYQGAEASYPSIGQFEMQHPSPNPNIHVPLASSFAARHFDPVERASSVPPAPSYSSMLPSRPTSPMKPVLQRKQSIIQNGIVKDAAPVAKPKSSASPEDLMAFKKSKSIHTLLIDVRTRAEFEKEHIENQPIICIEPIVLNRTGLTAEALENALELNPKTELALFQNRHIFEYVVIYDQNSITPSHTMKTLMDAIFVNSVHGKLLKHPPMLLVGGLDACKAKYGDEFVVKEANKSFSSTSSTMGTPSPRPLPLEPFKVPDSGAMSNGLMSPTIMPSGMSSTTNGIIPHTNGVSNGPMSPTFASQPMDPTQLWNPPARSRADTSPNSTPSYSHRTTFSVDQGSNHIRAPAEINYTGRLQQKDAGLARRPALSRPPTSAGPSSFAYPTNGINYPPSVNVNARMSPATTGTEIASPAPVSLSSSLTRRRSDYIEQPSYPGTASPSGPVSYPTPAGNSVAIARPPPAAVPGTDTRPRQMSLASSTNGPPAIPPKPQFTAPKNVIPYWSDVEIGMTGLRNMGNTCYMNSAVQCLSATIPFARFFTDGRWRNEVNKYALRPGSSKASKEFLDGKTSFLFSNTLRTLWGSELPYIVPNDIWGHMATQYDGFNNKRQHDAGEWMGNLLALLSVELNRVTDPDDGSRPDEWFLDLATRPPAESNYKAWEKELMKENSIVFDCFGSLTRTMRQCQRCMKKSPSYLSNTILPLTFLPKYGSSRLTPRQCFESIFQTDEDMKGTNKWLCPVCKSLQDAKATTRLSHAPPVLLLQLSRYEDSSNGKKKNMADFPLRDLDISEWMVTQDPEVGGPSPDDARAQRPPYRYDLYAVVNHDGQTIDSGHYTSMILSGGRWKECNDSIIRNVANSEVITPKAYILCYKRKKT